MEDLFRDLPVPPTIDKYEYTPEMALAWTVGIMSALGCVFVLCLYLRDFLISLCQRCFNRDEQINFDDVYPIRRQLMTEQETTTDEDEEEAPERKTNTDEVDQGNPPNTDAGRKGRKDKETKAPEPNYGNGRTKPNDANIDIIDFDKPTTSGTRAYNETAV